MSSVEETIPPIPPYLYASDRLSIDANKSHNVIYNGNTYSS